MNICLLCGLSAYEHDDTACAGSFSFSGSTRHRELAARRRAIAEGRAPESDLTIGAIADAVSARPDFAALEAKFQERLAAAEARRVEWLRNQQVSDQ